MKQAIIVIRHAEDAKHWGSKWGDFKPSDDWKKIAENWPTYKYDYVYDVDKKGVIGNKTKDFEVTLHGLSGKWKTDGHDARKTKHGFNPDGKGSPPWGENQAIGLRTHLNDFLAKHKYAPIGRAIVVDPTTGRNGKEPTPNPMDTLFPYLQNNSGIDLWLVHYDGTEEDGHLDAGLNALLKKQAILDKESGKSTIICSTGEALAGDDNILSQLSEQYCGRTFGFCEYNADGKAQFARCKETFVYTVLDDRFDTFIWGQVERFNFDSKEGFSDREEYHKRKTNPFERDR